MESSLIFERKYDTFYHLGRYNDYSLGFYRTDTFEMAKEWGVDKNRDGYANIYEIYIDIINILNRNKEKYGGLHWLTILLENREFDIPSALALEAKEYILNWIIKNMMQ